MHLAKNCGDSWRIFEHVRRIGNRIVTRQILHVKPRLSPCGGRQPVCRHGWLEDGLYKIKCVTP